VADYLFQVIITYNDNSTVGITVDVVEQEHMLLARDKAIAVVTENQSKYERPELTITSIAAVEAQRVQ